MQFSKDNFTENSIYIVYKILDQDDFHVAYLFTVIRSLLHMTFDLQECTIFLNEAMEHLV